MNAFQYFTNDEYYQLIGKWEALYPDLIQVRIIGESHEKRPLKVLILTNRLTGKDTEKPAVWLDANIHATEITGTTVTLFIVSMLLENYGKEEQITRLMDQTTYYIMPRINPDGADKAMAKPPRMIRSGVRPYPFEDKQDGLHEEDIDRDGRVLQMRIEDPNGDWKISSLDPRLMEKRSIDEKGGPYYRIFPEGVIENYDGHLIKKAPDHQGLDFNRNFPFEWRVEGVQDGAGPYPTSEPEIQAVVQFITGHPNINVAISYHTYSGVILRPYSTKPDNQMITDDLWVFEKIGRRGTELTGYRNVSVFHEFLYHPNEVTTGAFDDWMYDHLGVFSFTIELWDLPTEAGIKDRKFSEWDRNHPHEQDYQILQWIDQNAADGYVPWYPFDHPQLGKVELGGWDRMYSWVNPPIKNLEAEVRKNYQFALSLGEILPRLFIKDVSINPISHNQYLIKLILENTGYLPTNTSQQGKKMKAARGVRVDLVTGDKMKVIQGKQRVEVGHLEGRSNKFEALTFWASSPTDNRAVIEWVVEGQEGDDLKLSIMSQRGGTIETKLTLPGNKL